MGKNKLLDFVAEMDISDLTMEFAPSSRVEKLIGKITVKTLDAKTLGRISKKNTDKRGVEDSVKTQQDAIIACCIDPVLNEEEVLNAYKVHTSNELIDKIFTIGEQKRIGDEIMSLSGLGASLHEDIDDAKKS